MRTLYPVLTSPVLTEAQRPETVTEARWHQPLSVPVRRVALATAVVVSSGLLWAPFTPATAEVVTVDKWNAPLSVPVRRGGLPTNEQQSVAFVQAAPFAETTKLDKWFSPLALPVRQKPGLLAGDQQYLAFVKAAPFAESVTIDRWLQPLSLPTRRVIRQPGNIVFAPYVVVESVTLDKWFAPMSLPTRRIPSEAFQQALAWWPTGTIFPVTVGPGAVLHGIGSTLAGLHGSSSTAALRMASSSPARLSIGRSSAKLSIPSSGPVKLPQP